MKLFKFGAFRQERDHVPESRSSRKIFHQDHSRERNVELGPTHTLNKCDKRELDYGKCNVGHVLL